MYRSPSTRPFPVSVLRPSFCTTRSQRQIRAMFKTTSKFPRQHSVSECIASSSLGHGAHSRRSRHQDTGTGPEGAEGSEGAEGAGVIIPPTGIRVDEPIGLLPGRNWKEVIRTMRRQIPARRRVHSSQRAVRQHLSKPLSNSHANLSIDHCSNEMLF